MTIIEAAKSRFEHSEAKRKERLLEKSGNDAIEYFDSYYEQLERLDFDTFKIPNSEFSLKYEEPERTFRLERENNKYEDVVNSPLG